jgi:hypothetical protein
VQSFYDLLQSIQLQLRTRAPVPKEYDICTCTPANSLVKPYSRFTYCNRIFRTTYPSSLEKRLKEAVRCEEGHEIPLWTIRRTEVHKTCSGTE